MKPPNDERSDLFFFVIFYGPVRDRTTNRRRLPLVDLIILSPDSLKREEEVQNNLLCVLRTLGWRPRTSKLDDIEYVSILLKFKPPGKSSVGAKFSPSVQVPLEH